MVDYIEAGQKADELIAREVAGQDKMWGVANERTDSQSGQLLKAGLSQMLALQARRDDPEKKWADRFCSTDRLPYPSDSGGFRDYGSDVANLVVAAAFIRQEIKRLIANGADTTRLSRTVTQPYTADQPATSFPSAA